MPSKPNFAFDVKIRIPEAFTLETIVRNPRGYKPCDLAAASHNNEVVLSAGTPPDAVVKLCTYLVTDFFAYMHGTGLYNRQKNLWNSLAKVTKIYGYQMSSGLVKKSILPIYDLVLSDFKDKPQILVRFIDCQLEKPTMPLEHLKGLVSLATKLKTVTGIMLCFSDKVPATLLEHVTSHIATDPAGKYEAIWPGINIPLNLMYLEKSKTVRSTEESGDQVFTETSFHLAHPNLQKPRQSPPPLPTVTRAISST